MFILLSMLYLTEPTSFRPGDSLSSVTISLNTEPCYYMGLLPRLIFLLSVCIEIGNYSKLLKEFKRDGTPGALTCALLGAGAGLALQIHAFRSHGAPLPPTAFSEPVCFGVFLSFPPRIGPNKTKLIGGL